MIRSLKLIEYLQIKLHLQIKEKSLLTYFFTSNVIDYILNSDLNKYHVFFKITIQIFKNILGEFKQNLYT